MYSCLRNCKEPWINTMAIEPVSDANKDNMVKDRGDRKKGRGDLWFVLISEKVNIPIQQRLERNLCI